MPDVRVECGGDGEQELRYKRNENGGNGADDLEQESCEREGKRLRSEGDETEDAVDAPLQRNGDAAKQEGAQAITDEHHALAVPAIYEGTGRKTEEQVGDSASSTNETGLRGRMSDEEDEQRERKLGDLCA